MDPLKQLAGVALGLGLGAIQKHFFNGSKWYRPNIPNQLIPIINTTVGTAVGGALGIVIPGLDPAELAISGGIAGAASVGVHKVAQKPVMATVSAVKAVQVP